MTWLDRIYFGWLVIASAFFVYAAVTAPDPVRILFAILQTVWLVIAVTRMRVERRARL